MAERREMLKDEKDDVKYMAGTWVVSEGLTDVSVDKSVPLPQFPEDSALFEGQVEIAILPPVVMGRFIQLRRNLLNALPLRIIRTAGHWSRGALITAVIERPAPLLGVLMQTPGVEKVEVGVSEKGSDNDYCWNLGSQVFQLEPASCQEEMIFVTLKEELE